MKKIITSIVSLVLAVAISGCGAQSPVGTKAPSSSPSASAATPSATATQTPTISQSAVIKVGGLKGPTTMGMVNLIKDSDAAKTKNKYSFNITTVDDIVPLILKKEVDFAAVPANLAAVLNNNTKGEVQVLAINTLGMFYVVQKGSKISTVADLKGKTIYTTGKGATPEYTLNYILTANGLDPQKDVTVEYKSDAPEVVALLAQKSDAIAMLPEPFVTTAMAKVQGLGVALDMTKEWDKITKDGSTLISGVIVARKEFVDKNLDATTQFLVEYEQSIKQINADPKSGSELVEKYLAIPANVAEAAIPKSNITFISGQQMQQKLKGYLAVLNAQNPKSVGGSLPVEDFYRVKIK